MIARSIPILSRSDKLRLLYRLVRGNCWEYSRARDKDGYGIFSIGNKTYLVHRVMWVIKYGKIPKGLFVLHRCDNPSCCRPSHLFFGYSFN